MWTKVAKPNTSNWQNVMGKYNTYDQSNVTYDQANIYYDGSNPNAWSKVSKPNTSSWTKVNKPT